MMEKKVKPKIELKRLENLVINTKTQNEFCNLMKICEIAGFQWGFGLPTKANVDIYWGKYKDNTCIKMLTDYPLLYYASKSFYESKHPHEKVISMEQFYKINNISSEKLNEVNQYITN
jgi:hypothetical protein